MRRADRLFQIVLLLQSRRVLTAKKLAGQLEVSERTIYRDVRDLILSGVPINGEAGVGYALPRRFELPPLMFTPDELQALVLGTRVVESWADPALGRAAASALAKVEAVLPDRLRRRLGDTPLHVPAFHVRQDVRATLERLRGAVDRSQKVRLGYTRADGECSDRTVRPLGLFYWGSTWSLSAWCELRDAFRSFRIDRIAALDALETRFEPEPGRTLEDFLLLQDGSA